ncbi:hypothetical protein GCM10023340_08540 [Nocardioides marinquilinus]|uniref:Uncharacterized protein n=1 Tax=Nocardioides marinquilinus TaxID=1210400 RepID=A0ABP9PAR7_9ACTN
MTLTEAARLAHGLLQDPSTHTFAAASGWAYPATREALIMADLFDAFRQVHFVRPKPARRPWTTDGPTVEKRGRTDLTQDEVIAALRAAGHTAPLPTRTSSVRRPPWPRSPAPTSP